MTDQPEFKISRNFDASMQCVFDAWTKPEEMAQWWGPAGVEIINSKMDLREGGTYHYGMKTPDGTEMWGKFTYREITPPSRLVFINSFSDPQGGITRHPFAPTWPLELLSTISFEQEGNQTRMTIQWTPHNATEEETATFASGMESMQQGWSGTLDKFAEYIKGKSSKAA
jgi:uncharacterized protein YndB with AHSA1/START domain